MPPPLYEQHANPAVSAGESSGGNQLTLGEKIANALDDVDQGYALSYRDPTGEAAIRAQAEKIRAALGWKRHTLNKLVMGPDKLPIHLDDDLTERLFIFLAVEASMKPTKSGKGFRAALKKNNPSAVTKFGDSDSTGARTETPTI